MRILAIDTSTTINSVCILDDNGILVEHIVSSRNSHNRVLLRNLDICIREAGTRLEEIDALAVALGPGSFTGLRIGISTAKTLAWANRLPVLGIPTLDALALNVPCSEYPVCALLDARKKEVYCSIYRNTAGYPESLTKYLVLLPEKLAELISSPTVFVGNGWLLYESFLKKKLRKNALSLPPSFHTMRASNIATLARLRLEKNDVDDPVTLKPIYVRPSDAEAGLKQK